MTIIFDGTVANIGIPDLPQAVQNQKTSFALSGQINDRQAFINLRDALQSYKMAHPNVTLRIQYSEDAE